MTTTKKILNIDFLGPYGSGKGTQAEYLINDLELDYFVMGEVLKKEIAMRTKLGRKIEKIVKAGDLVGDQVIGQLFSQYLAKADKNRGILFDGLPRNMGQKKIFDDLVAKFQREPLFIFIDISREESQKRLSMRRVCEGCGDQPVDGNFTAKTCKKCGGKIAVRYDDTPEIIAHRIKVYEREVRPVIDTYLRSGQMFRVEGEQDPLAVHLDIMKIIKEQGYNTRELHKK